jgi:hypothetical protein
MQVAIPVSSFFHQSSFQFDFPDHFPLPAIHQRGLDVKESKESFKADESNSNELHRCNQPVINGEM